MVTTRRQWPAVALALTQPPVMATHLSESAPLAVLRALVDLSAVDLLYADRYLCRAETLLATVCTRRQYRTLRHDHVSLPSLTAEIRHATEQGDWSKVRLLAQQAAAVRERLAAGGQILLIADAVYGPRLLHADATTLALSGVVALPHSNLARARDALLGQLETLAAQDSDWAAFYCSRAAHFALCRLVRGQNGGATLDVAELRQQILTAVAVGDFARVKRLTASSTAEDGEVWARLCAPEPVKESARELAAVFPPASPTRARELGLAMETLQGIGSLNRYLGRRCAERATLPAAPLSEMRQALDGGIGSLASIHGLPPNEVLLGADLARRLRKAVGAPITILGRSWWVYGVLPPLGSSEDLAVVMHLSAAQEARGVGRSVNEIRLYTTPAAPILEIAALLRSAHPDLSILTSADRGGSVEQETTATLRRHRTVVYWMTALAAAIGLASAPYLNAAERRVEMAMLVAMGSTATSVLVALVARGAIIGVVGALVGYALGAGIAVGQDIGAGLSMAWSWTQPAAAVVAAGALSVAASVPASIHASYRDHVRLLQE